jgi:ribosomal protein S18 acetylase RimI-like enzyme
MSTTGIVDYREGGDLPFDQLLSLYQSVKWIAYTNERRRPELQKAIRNSTFVVSAWVGDTLVGLARGLSDDSSIFYLQDILVRPEFQREGIGRKLINICLERYKHVRNKVLLTDDEEKQKRFYESMGFVNTQNLQDITINTFVQLEIDK